MYNIKSRKVTRYYADVEIDTTEIDFDEEGVGSRKVKKKLKKSFGQELTAQKWVANIYTFNEIGYYCMNDEERKKFKSKYKKADHLRKVNEVGKKLFGRTLYRIYEDDFWINNY